MNPLARLDIFSANRRLATVFALLVVVGTLIGIAGRAPAADQSAVKERPKNTVAEATEEALTSHLDLAYAQYGDRKLTLDLYRPANVDGDLPAIVCIHGGGWFKGDRKSMTELAQGLAARGFVTAAISYRLSGEAIFPAQISDCKAAVRWLRANAKTYKIDSNRIGATGLSAGGHLTALLATSGGVKELEGDGGNADQRSDIQAAVPMGAQTDLASDRIAKLAAAPDPDNLYRKFLGGSAKDKPEAYRAASPLHYLDANDPPIFLMAGEKDDPSTHGDLFREATQKLGHLTLLHLVAGAPHAFIKKGPWLTEAVDLTASFFTLHLKTKGH